MEKQLIDNEATMPRSTSVPNSRRPPPVAPSPDSFQHRSRVTNRPGKESLPSCRHIAQKPGEWDSRMLLASSRQNEPAYSYNTA